MPQDATLTPRQRNAVFRAITAVGLAPDSFKWHEETKGEGYPSGQYRMSVVTHPETGFWFSFGNRKVAFNPGAVRKVEWADSEGWEGWGGKVYHLNEWLARVHVESTTPDLWASIAQETALPKAASSSSLDNRPFTTAEQILIAAKLDEIKAFLVEGQQFATEQAETVEREFAYQREASVRLGRKDWLNSFIGNMMSLVIGLMLDPAKAKGILRLAGEAFQSLWGMAAGYLQ